MIESLKFPDPQKLAAERAREFQRLTPDERWRELAAMWKFGWSTINASPRRAAILRRMDEQEEEWRSIQRELFSRYAN